MVVNWIKCEWSHLTFIKPPKTNHCSTANNVLKLNSAQPNTWDTTAFKNHAHHSRLNSGTKLQSSLLIYYRSMGRCSGNDFFYNTFHSSQKNPVSYRNCRFTNFNVSFEKHFVCENNLFFLLWVSSTFSTPTSRGRHISKKARRKNLPL